MDNSAVATDTSAQRAGDLLRQGRLKQRLVITDCAKRTHIALRFLEALEENRWQDLPSESHRRGFIRSYATFLGLSAEDILSRYLADHAQTVASTPASTTQESPKPQPVSQARSSFYPASMGQWVVMVLVGFIVLWVGYHWLGPNPMDANAPLLSRPRVEPKDPRLVVTKPVSVEQRVRIKALKRTWVRVRSLPQQQLLFEGLLNADVEKTWSGAGPFEIKLGDIHAVQVFWNDQLFDTSVGASGSVNTLQLPPQK